MAELAKVCQAPCHKIQPNSTILGTAEGGAGRGFPTGGWAGIGAALCHGGTPAPGERWSVSVPARWASAGPWAEPPSLRCPAPGRGTGPGAAGTQLTWPAGRRAETPGRSWHGLTARLGGPGPWLGRPIGGAEWEGAVEPQPGGSAR